MAWRPMTAEELASRPEARLEGSLLLIVLCGGALGVGAVMFLLLGLIAIPAVLSGGPMSGMAARTFTDPSGLAMIFMVPTLYMTIWGLVFSIMTAMRSPATPSFAAGGLVGWIGVHLLVSVTTQIMIGGGGLVLVSVLPTLLGLLGELMLVAGFWIYMRDGVRPNGYYRRLIQA